jgi:hypothetical protein
MLPTTSDLLRRNSGAASERHRVGLCICAKKITEIAQTAAFVKDQIKIEIV